MSSDDLVRGIRCGSVRLVSQCLGHVQQAGPYLWFQVAECHRQGGVSLPLHNAEPRCKFGQWGKFCRLDLQGESVRIGEWSSCFVGQAIGDLDPKGRRLRERTSKVDTADERRAFVAPIQRRTAAASMLSPCTTPMAGSVSSTKSGTFE